MGLEYKSYDIEIKANSELGTFVGLASPYNNIDDGSDRAKPTIGKRNNNKTVPMLWQHDTKKVLGSLLLIDTKEGIQANGKLILDKDENNQYMIPKAAEAYALLKKGLLKLSIGYKTLTFSYETEKGQAIRNLDDIDICEVSLVTFPMNTKATISDVKSQELEAEKKEDENLEIENKDGNRVEEKAMSFTDLLKVQQANDMRWKLQDALNSSFRQLMNDENMEIDAKLAQLEANVNDFATAYKEAMKLLLQASSKSKTAKKEIQQALEIKKAETEIETKENLEDLETKAGKKISKANKTKLSQCKDMMGDLMTILASLCADDSGEEEDDKSKKKDPVTESSSVNSDDKQKKNNCDTLELKSEELAMLQGISNYFIKKGDE